VIYSWQNNLPPKPGAEVAVVATAPNAGVAAVLPKLKPIYVQVTHS